jgi:acyl-coenzyme A thioesterase 13
MNKILDFLKQQVGKDSRQSPSPLMQWLNPVLLSVEEGKLSLEYTVRPEMTNPVGNLHGGITAAIIDDAIGATMFSFGEPVFYTTINNVIDYFAWAKAGEKVIAETFIIKKGKQIVNAHCDIWNGDKTRLLAKGYTNLMKTEIKE